MFVLASLMALAAAGVALDLTSASDQNEDDPEPVNRLSAVGEADWGQIGDVSSSDPELDPREVSETPPAASQDHRITGGSQSDDLRGGHGHDTIVAGAGNDWVMGDGEYEAAGNDELHGGQGADSLAGQGGDDIVWGDEHDDTIQGGDGDDTLFGGVGTDWLSGHDGDDVLVAGGGGDDLDGGRGHDLLVGDNDPLTVWAHGGDGNDTLMPGAGDFVEGQAGADDFVLRRIAGALPVIADFNADEDQLILHLPESIADNAKVDLTEDTDGTFLLTVNGEPIGRMLQGGGMVVSDIVIARMPG